MGLESAGLQHQVNAASRRCPQQADQGGAQSTGRPGPGELPEAAAAGGLDRPDRGCRPRFQLGDDGGRGPFLGAVHGGRTMGTQQRVVHIGGQGYGAAGQCRQQALQIHARHLSQGCACHHRLD